MFKFMRQKEAVRNVILFIVCAAMSAYVLVGMGAAPPTAPSNKVSTVGGVPIQYRDVFMIKSRYRNYFNGQIDENVIYSSAARSLIDNAILLEGAEDLDVVVSDGELRDFVIAQRTLSDGSFVDEETWARHLQSNYRQNVGAFEEYMRNHDLRIQKFSGLFYGGAFVSEEAIQNEFLKGNQKVKMELMVLNTYDVREEVKLDGDDNLKKFYDENKDQFLTGDLRKIQYLNFPVSEYRNQVELTDAEVKTYYESNQERYRAKEQVKANHILIKTDTLSDEEALAKIEKVQKEIAGGLDFSEAAKKYSTDGSASQGGDLGFFSRERMVKPFSDAAFALANGEISQPVKTQFGYHLIQRVDHKPESMRTLEEVSASIRNTLSSERAKDKAKEAAKTFADEARTNGFVEAAKVSGKEPVISDFFDNNNQSSIDKLLRTNFQTRRAVFAMAELNDISEVIDAGTNVVVAQWVDQSEPQSLDFEKDKNRIRSEAEKVAAATFIKNEFAAIKEAALKAPDKTFQDLKGKRDYLKDNHFRTTDFVDANTVPWEIRREDLDFEKDVYGLDAGAFIDSMETSSPTRFVLARVIEKQAADMDKLAEARFEIVERLRNESGSDMMRAYLFERRKSLDPKRQKEAQVLAAFQR